MSCVAGANTCGGLAVVGNGYDGIGGEKGIRFFSSNPAGCIIDFDLD